MGLSTGLTVDTVVPYLVLRGLLSEQLVADGGLQVEGLLRRNRNLRVVLPDGGGFFLKQADDLAVGSGDAVAAEARFYTSMPITRPALLGSVPQLIDHDPASGVLVLQLLGAHQTLRELADDEGPRKFPLRIWRALGGLLATAHETVAGDPSSVTAFVLTREPAPESLAVLRPAALAVLRVVRESGLRELLDEVAGLWEPTAFVHGDIRVDNVMIGGRAGDEGEDVRLVDWEMAGRGDPLWDLAGALECAVTLTWGRFGAVELCLPAVQAAARALWSSYGQASDAAAGSASKLAAFTAARLVLTAMESINELATPTRRTMGYLQVAQNILAHPAVAATELFALATAA